MAKVYSRKEAAKILGISVETVDRCRKSGKLPFHKIGDRIVFTESDLTTFLNNCGGNQRQNQQGVQNENPS